MKKLLFSLSIAFLAISFSCGGDDGNDPGDPNDFCNIEACATNSTLKAVCIDEYNDCVSSGVGTKSECAVFAAETCTV